MKKKIIIVIAILLGIIVLLFINRFKLSPYTNLFGKLVQNEFEEKYGVESDVIWVINSESNRFGGTVRVKTSDGAIADCEYSLLGDMTSDSYSNIVYAHEDIKRVEQYVNKYYKKYIVVESFDISRVIDDFYFDSYKVEESGSATYEDYLETTKEHQRYLVVELYENEDFAQLDDLLQDLENEFVNQENFTVLIKKAPEGLLSAYEGRSIIANYMGDNYSYNYDALGNGVSKDFGPLYDINLVAVYNFGGETKVL